MGFFGGNSDYTTVEISDDWVKSGALSAPEEATNAIYVKPHEDDGGIGIGTDLLTSLHNPSTSSKGFLGRKSVNDSSEISFEITYSQEAMGFKFVSRNEPTIQTVETQLDNLLPNSEFERQEPNLLDFRSGRHVCAAELGLKDYTLRPLKHKELEGFNTDPLGQIAAQMIGLVDDQKATAEVAVQTVLKPAKSSWTQGVSGEGDIGAIAEDLEADTTVHPWHPTKFNNREASKIEEKTAKLVRNQTGRHGWWFNIRIIAVSEDPQEAKRRVRETAGMYRRFYLSETEQGFEPRTRSGDALKQTVENAVQRNYIRGSEPMVKSENEVAGFVHIPDGDFSTRDLERSTTKGDEGVPPSLPQFKDFDQTGYTESDIPRRSWEQQNSDDYEWEYWPQMESASGYLDVNAHEYGMEAREPGSEGDLYAGAHPRAMIENAANDPEQPYWVGIDSNYKTVPILHRETFRHLFVTGQTGTGKSTFVLDRLQQHALKGHGFAFVDPGGEDCFELMKMLPEDRLDDVVFIDITNSGPEGNNERHIGFNFLETHNAPGENGFNAEVEGIVSDILPLLEADQYQRMKGVAANILRALIRANYADTGYTYTLLDMYYILANEEGRQRYAQFVREEQVDDFLEIFADEVAELEDSDLEPLIRRLQTWIENAMIRPIVSERNPQFSIGNAVEDNSILIIKCDTSKDVRQMVSSTITRKIWSVVTARPSRTEKFLQGEEDIDLPKPLLEASAGMGGKGGGTEDGEDGTSPSANADAGEIHVDDLDLTGQEVVEHEDLMLRPDGRVEADRDAQAEHEPYYLVIDELHSVLSEESQIEQMLAEARKKRLGLILLTQQTVQLNDEQKRQIMSNCSTLMAFNPGQDGSERRAIADGFSGLEKDDLGVDNYRAWTMVTDKEGKLSQPFQTRMFPQYPPRRGRADLRSVIDRSLNKYGTKIKSTDQIHGDVPDHFSGGGGGIPMDGEMEAAEFLDDGGLGPTAGGDGRASAESEQGKQALYEAIHTIQVRRDRVGQHVPSEEVKDEWQRRTGDIGYDSIPSNLIEQDAYIQRTRASGDVMLNLTHEGMEAAGLTFNTGSSASGGKDHHRMVLEFSYQAFTKLGMETWLPEQEGAEEADGMADLPVKPSGADNFRKTRRLEQEARDELIESVGTDAAFEITDGRHISIEAETSTMQAPEQTLTNLRKALDAERFCVFACKDEHSSDDYGNDTFYWPKRGEKIIYDTYQDGRQVKPDYDKKTYARDIDEDDNRTFYNRKKGYFSIEEDVFVLRKRTDAEKERGKTTEIAWEEDGDEIVLRDRGISDGEGGYIQEPQNHLRFDSQEDIANVERADVKAYYAYDASEEVYTVRKDGQTEEYETEDELLNNWARMYPPFLPDVHFPHEPREDDYAMVVFPDDDNPEYDEPVVYDKGDVRPLLPDEIEMPDIPEPDAIKQAEPDESEEGEAEEGNPESNQGGGSTDDIDDEQLAELTKAIASTDGISPEQASIGAERIVDAPMDWEAKVDTATTLARNVNVENASESSTASAATDGGVSDESSSSAQGQAQPESPASPQEPNAHDGQNNPSSSGSQSDQQSQQAAHEEASSNNAPQGASNTGGDESGQYDDASSGLSGFSLVGDDSSESDNPNSNTNPPAQSENGESADGRTPDAEAQTDSESESANPESDSQNQTTNDADLSESTSDAPAQPEVDDDTQRAESTDTEDTTNENTTPSTPDESSIESDDPTPETGQSATSDTVQEDGRSDGNSDENESDDRTVQEKFDERVNESEDSTADEKVEDMKTIYKMRGFSEDEARRKAEIAVHGEASDEPPQSAKPPESAKVAESPKPAKPAKVDGEGQQSADHESNQPTDSTSDHGSNQPESQPEPHPESEGQRRSSDTQITPNEDPDSDAKSDGQSPTETGGEPAPEPTPEPHPEPEDEQATTESETSSETGPDTPEENSPSEGENKPDQIPAENSDEPPQSPQPTESTEVAESGDTADSVEGSDDPNQTPAENSTSSAESESETEPEPENDNDGSSSSGGIWDA